MKPREKQSAAGDFLTLDEVARRLNVNRETVRRLALAGKIRFIRVGARLRIREAWVEEFINAQSE
jgi:excisionase family DNA binding protein